ncbi:probable xyloglucan galactosyltransferase GT14 [Rhodamnia argentea]|uniref:Probable xyloglucan galactosyltransferase GT14 n=1 Tax=Rhodamnia argentea TaxID=178133 RepID=A0A8B8QKX3_9MYRT|nr:probable xyloglucan galactosyltransferase GT14 [Rhodamnia argentea]
MLEKKGHYGPQVWFVVLISSLLCLVLLFSFDRSFLSGGGRGGNNGVAFFVDNYENSIDTRKPESLPFGRSLNKTIDPAPIDKGSLLKANNTARNREVPNVGLSPPGVIVGDKSDDDSASPTNQSSEHQSIDMGFDRGSCSGRFIYIHDLPGRFNNDLLRKCESLTRGTDVNMCPYMENLGMGPAVADSGGVLLNSSWFRTNQFLLEVIFHNKMKRYECLTNDSSLASAIYVPYYAGLDISQYLWSSNISVRDATAFDLVRWLSGRPEWRRMSGRDYFLVAGRIAWDFRRQSDNPSYWGSKLMFLPQSQNMTMLSVESSVWNNDFAIPYPTYFHPSKGVEVAQWQDRMRKQERKYLFAFVGAPRPELEFTIRGEIINQCLVSNGKCKLLNCSSSTSNCDDPVNVMKVFRSSVFCLQPRGDSYTRRSTFDSILAGCIPVFFHPGTAYVQYVWHLPRDHTKYSVFIPLDEAKKVSIEPILQSIPENEVWAMREEVIRLIPRIVYADPRSKEKNFDDAFEIAIKGVLERIGKVRKAIASGADPSIGFAEQNHQKFDFPMSEPEKQERRR